MYERGIKRNEKLITDRDIRQPFKHLGCLLEKSVDQLV